MTDLKTTFPRLHYTLEEMALDNGRDILDKVALPADWVERAASAEAELARLTDEEVHTLVAGEETDQLEVAARAPRAYEVVCAAFDDELGVKIYVADDE